MEEKLLEGIEEARSGLEPVTIHRGTGHCGFAPFHPSLEAALRDGILKLKGVKRNHVNRALQAGASQQPAGKRL